MPTVSDPKARYEYVLRSDRDKPIEERPVFFFQVWTVRHYRAQKVTIDALELGKDNEEVMDASVSLVTGALVDWHNVRVPGGESLLPFDAEDKDAIEDVVGVDELMELAFAVANQRPSPEDKKKLSSQLTSDSDSADQKPVED